jgi:nucleoid DNA-binding protein
MSVKDFLMKKLSLKLNVSERVIDAVISNQFSSAFQATSHYNTIEISGFGKFIFSQVKAKRQMKKYMDTLVVYDKQLEDPDITADALRGLNLRKASLLKSIEHLKPKMRE